MLIKELFISMGQKVEEIASLLPTNDLKVKQQLEGQVEAIKQISDTILDEWIQFEEKMQLKIGGHFPDIFTPSTITETTAIQTMTHAGGEKEDFYKAKGYYDLGLYKKSYSILSEFVFKEPDHEFARLYLAYSAHLSEMKEEALQHFSLLRSSSINSKIRAVCCNSIGIILFDELQYEGANRFFSQAIQEDKNLFVAHYNLGMSYYIEGNYKEAIKAWETYLELTHDHDLDLILYLSNSYLRLGQYSMAMEIVQIMLPQNDEKVLLQLGKFFEDAMQYDEAIDCYRNLQKQNPKQIEGLHGLGWNLWLLNQSNDQSIAILKKALCLDSGNLNILFSLAWMYFHLNKIEDSEKVIQYILDKDNKSPLAVSLSLLIALHKGDQLLVEERIKQLQEQKDQRNRALGEMFMGKLKLRQNRLQDALDSFKRSVRNNPHLRESYLLQGFVYFINHEYEMAEKYFKKQNIVTFIK